MSNAAALRVSSPKNPGSPRIMVVHVSPSQIKLERLCERKYAIAYNQGIKEPSGKKQDFGKEVHTEIEAYLPSGVVPPEDTDARKALRTIIKPDFLPTPSDRVLTEHEISYVPEELRGEGIVFVGYIDFADPEADIPLVGDAKTTTDPRYMMTVEDFERDPQRLVYAKYIADTYGVRYVNTRWLYVIYSGDGSKEKPRKFKKARKREGVVDTQSPAFKEAWAGILETARKIAAIRRANQIGNAHRPNIRACKAFGGCKLKKHCSLTPGQKLASYLVSDDRVRRNKDAADAKKELPQCGDNVKSETESGPQLGEDPMALKLSDLIAQQGGAAAKPAATPATTPAPAASTPAPAATPAANATAPAAAGTAKKRSLIEELQEKAKAAGVNPPEATAASTPPPTPAPDPEEDAEESGEDEETEEAAAAPTPAPTPAPAADKPKRGRPPKSVAQPVGQPAATPAPATPVAGTPAAAPVSTPAPTPAPAPAAAATPARESFLGVYFDCHFTKGAPQEAGVRHLAEIVAPIAKQIEEALGVVHWSAVEFAKGAGLLASGLDELLTDTPMAGVILADSVSLEGRACRTVLLKHARFLVDASAAR